jgi:hypothetical protein
MEYAQFIIEYNGLKIRVKTQLADEVEIFRLIWPDESIDYLYKNEDGNWKSKTVMDEVDIKAIGKILETKIGG